MKQLAGLHVQLRLSFIFVAFRSLRLASAANFRHSNDGIEVVSSHVIARKGALDGGDSLNISSCALANMSAASVSKAVPNGNFKLRVCNAATTNRKAKISALVNGKQLNTDDIEQRKCEEYVVPIMPRNKFEVKLSGQVLSDWSAEKTEEEMKHIPVIFLVAYVFGQGDDTIFTVNEFHGEDNGLNSVQVAYMDIVRGAPAAKLQLVSPSGSFQIDSGTFVHVCAGSYSLQFLRKGEEAPISVGTQLVTSTSEQYVVMRLAPEGSSSYDGKAMETVIVFPDSSRAPSVLSMAWLLPLLCMLALWHI